MDNFNNQGKTSKDEYNEIPVYYCRNCLSLNIVALDDMDYCEHCSSTDIDTTDIFTWESKKKLKYGENEIKGRK